MLLLLLLLLQLLVFHGHLFVCDEVVLEFVQDFSAVVHRVVAIATVPDEHVILVVGFYVGAWRDLLGGVLLKVVNNVGGGCVR